MGAQHTPGPWVIGKDDETGGVPFIQIENDTQTVCEVSSVLTDWDRSEFEITDEVRANAALISAAPELLEQAILFERTIAFYIRQDEKAGDDEAANMKRVTLASVQAVRAKAEGRS